MSTDTDLKPCPFCGSTNLSTENARDFISCLDCHAEGPMPLGMGMGDIQSAAAWNRRAALAAPAAAPDVQPTPAAASYRGPLRTPAGDPAWIPRDGRQPEQGQRVRVLMDAGGVGNPLHPGYPSGKWEEETEAWNPGGPRGATYACEIAQTGYASHWMPLPAAPTS